MVLTWQPKLIQFIQYSWKSQICFNWLCNLYNIYTIYNSLYFKTLNWDQDKADKFQWDEKEDNINWEKEVMPLSGQT